MNARLRSLSLIIMSGLFATAALGAQQPASGAKPRARIVVFVDDATREPIADAEVTDLVTKNSVKTSKDGAIGLFVPEFVKPDGAILRIRKVGYDPIGALAVDPKVDTTLVVPMHRTATELPTVHTTASYRVDTDAGERAGIEARCGAVHAVCISAAQLEERPTQMLSRFVKQTGATKPGTPGMYPEPIMAGIDGRPCKPTYYVDGLKWYGNFAGLNSGTIDNNFRPGDVATIEVYRPEQARPLRWEGNPNCGVIVVWTKQ